MKSEAFCRFLLLLTVSVLGYLMAPDSTGSFNFDGTEEVVIDWPRELVGGKDTEGVAGLRV